MRDYTWFTDNAINLEFISCESYFHTPLGYIEFRVKRIKMHKDAFLQIERNKMCILFYSIPTCIDHSFNPDNPNDVALL